MSRVPQDLRNSVMEAVFGQPDGQNILQDLRDEAIANMNSLVYTSNDPNAYAHHKAQARVEIYTYLINLGNFAKDQNARKSQPKQPK